MLKKHSLFLLDTCKLVFKCTLFKFISTLYKYWNIPIGNINKLAQLPIYCSDQFTCWVVASCTLHLAACNLHARCDWLSVGGGRGLATRLAGPGDRWRSLFDCYLLEVRSREPRAALFSFCFSVGRRAGISKLAPIPPMSGILIGDRDFYWKVLKNEHSYWES